MMMMTMMMLLLLMLLHFLDDDDDEEEDGFRGGRVRGDNYHEVWKMHQTKTNTSKQNIVQNSITECSSRYNYLMLGL